MIGPLNMIITSSEIPKSINNNAKGNTSWENPMLIKENSAAMDMSIQTIQNELVPNYNHPMSIDGHLTEKCKAWDPILIWNL